MRVLFVENHLVFAKTVIAAFLAGHDVEVVTTVAAALGALAKGRYDVALVDFDLDDGKGDEFVRRARVAGCRVPMVAVSSRPEGNAALVAAGATTTCAKGDFAAIGAVLASVVAC